METTQHAQHGARTASLPCTSIWKAGLRVSSSNATTPSAHASSAPCATIFFSPRCQVSTASGAA